MARAQSVEALLGEAARLRELRLTARGRRSGRPRSVTIWFVPDDDALGVGSLREDRNWIRNALAHGEVEVDVGGRRLQGRLRRTSAEEHARIRRAMARKYLPLRLARLVGAGQRFTFRIEELRPRPTS